VYRREQRNEGGGTGTDSNRGGERSEKVSKQGELEVIQRGGIIFKTSRGRGPTGGVEILKNSWTRKDTTEQTTDDSAEVGRRLSKSKRKVPASKLKS